MINTAQDAHEGLHNALTQLQDVCEWLEAQGALLDAAWSEIWRTRTPEQMHMSECLFWAGMAQGNIKAAMEYAEKATEATA